MRTIEMILMTKSSKYGGYCVAGFDADDGRWIRLVSNDADSHGALSDEMLYDRRKRRCAGVLDRVEVHISREVPGQVQTENVLVDGNDRIRIIKKATLSEAMALHPCEERDELFASHHYMVGADIQTVRHSLEFVCVRNLHLHTVPGSHGKLKYKVDFELRGRQYTMFSMTDPAFYDKRNMCLDSAALALSISDDEWSRANGHYIYVAKIFDLTKKRKKRAVGKRNLEILRRTAVCMGVLALLVLVWGWLVHMNRVYVPQHTGARYHVREECEWIANPQAARAVPSVIGRIFFKPCGECAITDTEG